MLKIKVILQMQNQQQVTHGCMMACCTGGVEVRTGGSSITTPPNRTPPPVPRPEPLSPGAATGVPEAELGCGDSMAERRSASRCSSCCICACCCALLNRGAGNPAIGVVRTVGDDTFNGDAAPKGDVTKVGDGTLGVDCSFVLPPFSALRAGFLFKSGSLAGTSW